jgi:hypothetical protein
MIDDGFCRQGMDRRIDEKMSEIGAGAYFIFIFYYFLHYERSGSGYR